MNKPVCTYSLWSGFFAALLMLSALPAARAQTQSTSQTQPQAQGRATAKPLDKVRSAPACPALLQHQIPRLQDEVPQDLCQFAGKVLLVVNTASYCGFTGQYEGLEALYAKYQARGLVVLGFPSNDFGQQEPGAAKQIADLCFNTYGVKFPMFSKTRVTGAARHPLYAGLAKAAGESPQWNFHKYLVGRDGRVINHFASSIEPLNPRLVAAIDKAL